MQRGVFWTVWLSRHGQTALNSSHKLQGRHHDPPLNEDGSRQAAALGRALAQFLRDDQRVVLAHSPLRRAIQTAHAVAQHLYGKCNGVTLLDAFNEVEYGRQNDGTTLEAAKRASRHTWDAWRIGDVHARVSDDAESLAEIRDRIDAGLHALFAHCGYGAVSGVVITHSGLLAILMAAATTHVRSPRRHWLDAPERWHLDPDAPHPTHNCNINALVFQAVPGSPRPVLHLVDVLFDNYIDHIPQPLRAPHTDPPRRNGAWPPQRWRPPY